MTDYRLDDLAVLSGVSARNIRVYRERGLLDPPRRQGRSAYYDDRHLAQLRAISGLLRRGFSTAHVAEFIAGIRDGHDLGEVLGMHDAIFGTATDGTAAAGAVDPSEPEAARLSELGLAVVVDGGLVFTDATVADIVNRSPEPMSYVRTLLRVADAAREHVDQLSAAVVETLKRAAIERFGDPDAPDDEAMATLRRVVSDHRELADRVVADLMAASMQRHLSAAVSEYTTDVLLGGNWESTASD